MIYRRFGKTGLSMPVLTFGCMRSMHSWQDSDLAAIPNDSQTTLEAIMRAALSHGINHIETAQGYGSSERQVGQLLPLFQRSSYLLQTKVTPTENPDDFVNKVRRSMSRLQVDRLDLLAIHGINDHRSLWQSCRRNGCLAAARRLQDQGLVGHVGFSGHGPTDVIMAAVGHDEDGGFDFVNLHWYYIFDVNRPAIELAADRDLGVFIISPTDKGGHLHTPSPELVDLCAPLSPMLFNDIYCLRQPGVCTISIGASAPEHFDEHMKALPYLENSADDPIGAIDQRLREAMRTKTGNERPDHGWDRLPPWDQAPGAVNLRMVNWLYNLACGWGMSGYARARYAMLNEGSSWVPGNDAGRSNELDFASLDGLDPAAAEQLKTLMIDAHRQLANN